MPTSPGARRDLAVALWRRSPLARRDVASAVQVDVGAAEPSLFSYGLTVRDGEIDPESLPPAGVRADHWIDGGATVVQSGGAHDDARSRVAGRPVLDRAAGGAGRTRHLRGARDRSAARPPRGRRRRALRGGAALAVHEGDRALLLPWRRSTPPERAPSGVARHAGRRGLVLVGAPRRHHHHGLSADGSGPLAGLERIGIHAVGSLLAAAVLAALGLLLMLGDDTFRRRLSVALRSYSRRLILILTVLIVVPLLLLDAVLVRALDQRLETEHRDAAEVALEVAQRVLSDYLLALEPGFGIRAVLEQEVLDWLAQVVDREVNVYWGSQSFASSRPELFTAGLLPTRIPGDVFSELALRQDALAARTRTAAGRTYLELYAPLEVAAPDVPLDRRFYLSTPLLAQEEAVSLELARLGRRVVVVTVALLLLVLAVGARLAAGFTRPVMEIVEGTDRIARGATIARPAPERARAADAGGGDRRDGAARGAEPHRPAAREAGDREDDREHHHRGGVARSGPPRDAAQPGRRDAARSRGRRAHRASRRDGADRGARAVPARCGAASAAAERRCTAACAPPAAEDREWSVVWVPVPGGGDPAALLVVEDVTEILRAQRLEAWAEMARIIAHEVKNPLTPIRLSTEHMQQVYATDPARFDEVFERCTRNILVQVEELRAIASEFSTYSRVPHMDLRPGDVVALARSVTAAYQAAPPPGVDIRFESTAPAAPGRFDERLLARALRNLLENAVRASRDRGEVTVRVDTDDGTIAIDVSDRGPGVRARGHEPHLRALLLDLRRRAPGSACRSRAGSSKCTAAASSAANRAGGGLVGAHHAAAATRRAASQRDA